MPSVYLTPEMRGHALFCVFLSWGAAAIAATGWDDATPLIQGANEESGLISIGKTSPEGDEIEGGASWVSWEREWPLPVKKRETQKHVHFLPGMPLGDTKLQQLNQTWPTLHILPQA